MQLGLYLAYAAHCTASGAAENGGQLGNYLQFKGVTVRCARHLACDGHLEETGVDCN